jgi:hypothetical protein
MLMPMLLKTLLLQAPVAHSPSLKQPQKGGRLLTLTQRPPSVLLHVEAELQFLAQIWTLPI